MAPRKVQTRKSRRNLKEIGLNQMTVDLQLKIRRRGSAAGQMKKSASWREEMHLYDTTAPGYKNRGSPVASQPGGGGGGVSERGWVEHYI